MNSNFSQKSLINQYQKRPYQFASNFTNKIITPKSQEFEERKEYINGQQLTELKQLKNKINNLEQQLFRQQSTRDKPQSYAVNNPQNSIKQQPYISQSLVLTKNTPQSLDQYINLEKVYPTYNILTLNADNKLIEQTRQAQNKYLIKTHNDLKIGQVRKFGVGLRDLQYIQ